MKNKVKIFSVLRTIAVMISYSASCKTKYSTSRVNMISTRNIDSKVDYVLLKSYSGGSNREIMKAIRKTKATTLEAAVDETVKNVAGGEYLMNAKVFVVRRNYPPGNNSWSYFVEGDVYGIGGNENYRGFKVGDIVQWKELSITRKGEITGLTDSENCMVREVGKENSRPIKYSSITKVFD